MTKYIEIVLPIPVDSSFTYTVPEHTECTVGTRVEVLFRSRKMIGYTVKIHDTAPRVSFIVKPILRVLETEPLIGAEQLKLAEWISKRYFCSLGEAVHMMMPGGKKEVAPPGLFEDGQGHADSEISLSPEQQRAVEGIINDKPGGISYVYGITGSGKTEVFLRAAKHFLDRGQSVIYLVPEIALTHQLVKDIGSRFGDTVGIIHSRLTPSQKLDQWKRIKSGEKHLILGARSAVFAPAQDTGLIIIDEEHESSYKSGSNPRYHARQIAMKIAAEQGARVVMGSATPSIEAYYLMQQDKITGYKLTKRLSGGELPAIEIVDLKGSSGSLSKELIEKIHKTKEEGHQTILFLNRRGFSYFFHCRSCGFELTCDRCSVSMTYHKKEHILTCHYCGYKKKPVDICPECGSLETGYSGFGTQKIEEDIQQTFPGYTIARLDTDSVKKKGALEHIIAKFKRGEIDILLGTQMVAKGLNFPNVKLVGIIQADTTLKLPDFRAAERTFSLITQVAGRAGRYFRDGIVLIQTFMPDHPAITLASRYMLEEFYNKEIEMRKILNFPPFMRIIRLVLRSKNLDSIQNYLSAIETLISDQKPEAVDVLGPSECPLAVISGNHRFQVIIRSSNYTLLASYTAYIRNEAQPPADIYLEFDPDPQTLL